MMFRKDMDIREQIRKTIKKMVIIKKNEDEKMNILLFHMMKWENKKYVNNKKQRVKYN